MFQFCNQNTLLTNVSHYSTVVTSLQQWQFDNSAGKNEVLSKNGWQAGSSSLIMLMVRQNCFRIEVETSP
jgi:hypothetical protein